MSNKIISKYGPEILFGIQNASVAIANSDQKIVWYNKSFKKIFGKGRLKGSNLFKLYSIPEKQFLTKTQKTFSHPIPESNHNIYITPIISKDRVSKQPGYFIELVAKTERGGNLIFNSHAVDRDITFLNELKELLVLLAKEGSLDKISLQIISKCAELSKSVFGLIVYHDDIDNYDILFHDPDELIKNKSETAKAVLSDFTFIDKWLELNKKSLLALNQKKNIGFNLTNTLKCETLIVSPCFFEEQLLATIIVGKTTGTFSTFEINIVKQLSVLLSFAISNLKTRDLNAALESRLLQAQKLEIIGKLSSGIAHDFGNLLTSIFGSVKLLRKRVSVTDDTKKLIDNIESCSVRARDLTKGLLSFGKPTPKRKELVKLNTVVNDISKVITQTFPSTITFINKTSEQLHDILGNSIEIYQVLLNLCVNAKEAMGGRGTLTLSANNLLINEKNIINHPLLKVGNYVCISVKDNGEGIKENDLQKIFDPYFSTKSKNTDLHADTESNSGSGLGLYVTYGIIKAHNGLIDVTSKINEGTQFDVYIPAFELPKDKKQMPADKIILLVDDEEMLSDLLAELLESNNYNVIKVSSGREALKVLTEEIKVDLAIIDYNMPDMNGLETIKEIRKLDSNLPVLLSSGTPELNIDSELDNYNITSCVQKPYEFETMLATIQKFI